MLIFRIPIPESGWNRMIQMTHVSKTYPNQVCALSDITLEISAGQFAFIVGPSGSGKTTLLRILFGAERPTSGEAVVNGFTISPQGVGRVHQLRRNMGIVFQDAKLLLDRTVSGNVALTLEVTGQFGREVKRKVVEALTEVGLKGRENDSILSLSAGEQQRVTIARALVHQPPLLLLDEPTGNLDSEMTTDVMAVFSHVHQKGTTVVFATHNTDLVRRYPYREIQILAGREDRSETGGERGPGD